MSMSPPWMGWVSPPPTPLNEKKSNLAKFIQPQGSTKLWCNLRLLFLDQMYELLTNFLSTLIFSTDHILRTKYMIPNFHT